LAEIMIRPHATFPDSLWSKSGFFGAKVHLASIGHSKLIHSEMGKKGRGDANCSSCTAD
jgi:hypothetical protein